VLATQEAGNVTGQATPVRRGVRAGRASV
jgi:hypothetical protein